MESLHEEHGQGVMGSREQAGHNAPFDVVQLVQRSPLLAFGAAVGVGYGLGMAGGQRSSMKKPGTLKQMMEQSSGTPRLGTADFANRYRDISGLSAQSQHFAQRSQGSQGGSDRQGWLRSLVPDEAQQELQTIGNAAIDATRQWMRDTLRQYVPAAREHVDNLERRAPLTGRGGPAPSQPIPPTGTATTATEPTTGSNFSI
jgi:hypothetical protein